MSLLEVRNLKISFPVRGGALGYGSDYIKAVDDISFLIEEGQTMGLIGESGSGKTTLGKSIVGLIKISSGEIYFNGKNISKYIGKNKSSYRRGIQIIFQDAYSSLNPKKPVLDIIAEPLRNFERLTTLDERKRVDELLEIVGMNSAAAAKYPHEFSIGQCQRIGIARAAAINPKLIIADEPVSALDLPVQAQILNFMKDIRERFKISYLFISHDLDIVKYMCDSLAVMQNGRFVELGTKGEIYNNPRHLYTKYLMASIPAASLPSKDDRAALRTEAALEYEKNYKNYYDKNGRAYDLKKINHGHYAALP